MPHENDYVYEHIHIVLPTKDWVQLTLLCDVSLCVCVCACIFRLISPSLRSGVVSPPLYISVLPENPFILFHIHFLPGLPNPHHTLPTHPFGQLCLGASGRPYGLCIYIAPMSSFWCLCHRSAKRGAASQHSTWAQKQQSPRDHGPTLWNRAKINPSSLSCFVSDKKSLSWKV